MLCVTGASEAYAALQHCLQSRLRGFDVNCTSRQIDYPIWKGNGFYPTKQIPSESLDLQWHILKKARSWGAHLRRVGVTDEVKFLHTAGCRTNPKGGGTEVLWEIQGSELWCGRLCQFRSVRQRERVASWTWPRALVRTSVPIPVRLTEKESHSGTMGHASVPFRHASGVCRFLSDGRWLHGVSCRAPVRGIFSDSVSSPMGAVARSGLQSASERDLF